MLKHRKFIDMVTTLSACINPFQYVGVGVATVVNDNTNPCIVMVLVPHQLTNPQLVVVKHYLVSHRKHIL